MYIYSTLLFLCFNGLLNVSFGILLLLLFCGEVPPHRFVPPLIRIFGRFANAFIKGSINVLVRP